MKNLIPVFLIALLMILGCSGQPLPADKLDYAGVWKADKISLEITKEGQVHYKNNRSGEKSIDAPIKEFKGNDFEVGIGPVSTTFKVSSPPRKAGDVWKMTVDDVELTAEK